MVLVEGEKELQGWRPGVVWRSSSHRLLISCFVSLVLELLWAFEGRLAPAAYSRAARSGAFCYVRALRACCAPLLLGLLQE